MIAARAPILLAMSCGAEDLPALVERTTENGENVPFESMMGSGSREQVSTLYRSSDVKKRVQPPE